MLKVLRNMATGDTIELIRNGKVVHITKVGSRCFKIIEEDGDITGFIHAHTVIHWLKYHTVKRWVTN